MPQSLEFDLKQTVLLNDTFGPREVRQMQEAIAHDFSQYHVLRDAVGELQNREEHTPASNVRLGVCLYLLGRYFRAIESLKRGDGGAMAHFYLAKSHLRGRNTPKPSRITKPPSSRDTPPAIAPWVAPKPSAMPTILPPRWPCSIRSPARLNRPPSTSRSARHRGRARRKSQRSGGPLRAGRGS